MSRKDFSILLLLAFSWGASFLFMRIASPELGPVVTTELRVTLAAATLLLFAAVTKRKLGIWQHWKQFLVLGSINAALPFTLICMAELHLSASLAAILNATTPMFAALAAWGTQQEKPGLSKSIGLVIGLLGVAVLVGWSPVPLSGKVLLSVFFSLGAALAYGFGGLYAARVGRGLAPLALAAGQQLGAAVVLLPLAVIFAPRELPSSAAVFSVLGLSFICTSVAYLLYFHLIQSVGAVKTVSVTFLVPVFGLMWGVIFLNEPVYANTLAGLAIILLSVTLVNRKTRPKTAQAVDESGQSKV
ncbi:membrane protein [Paenibacillus sp. FSL H7-0357]|jgi:drug/metabolite transporter (DMT)-like permease|uniref:DMT family transporter n=1 Tax=unclassified Paenibacillus TaxID=185978 RepID=UPI0004F8AE69|nr:DMT family transporter [Paenibacillus sp. FSL H7-0357]AIQ21045.1 membrane protein [Paenibacillus sp. FSL H7-0357]